MSGGKDSSDPIARFVKLFEKARKNEPHDATAVALATADPSGRPSERMELLKTVDERGFVFFTNYGSRKARELTANPHAALCAFWPEAQQQARIEGPVERLPDDESDAYFQSRPRGSRLAALASRQSQPLESHTALMSRYLKLQLEYGTGPIPRPDFWGGFLLRPERIEFWSNRFHRLHDRALWTRGDDGWVKTLLNP
jgi:pyridoxamine 5'-phosphate oxidase